MDLIVDKIERELRDVRETVHREVVDVPGFKMWAGDWPGAEAPGLDDSGWTDFRVGETWGGYDRVAWFRARVAVPPAWTANGDRLVLRFVVGPRDGGLSTAETQLFVNGRRLQAIDIWHEEAWLPPEVLAGDGAPGPEGAHLAVALRAWSGIYGVPDRRRFKVAQLARVDRAAEEFYHLAGNVLRVARLQNENDPRRVALLGLLDRACLALDWLKPGSPAYYASVARAGEILAAGLAEAGSGELKPTVVAVGHSHIDMAWMWRLRHTREKAVRTFSTMLHLMRQAPAFRYAHSSPQLYRFVREDAPEIYDQVRARVAEGRWEVLGGSWVEFDTNLPGGESLVRQILLGKTFTRQEFGQDPEVLWLPDSFGFSWVLPQLMARSGLKYFATAAISRSRFGHFPYDTFRWRGMDGSEVLAHLITTTDGPGSRYTYLGDLSPEQVAGNWRNYRHKELNSQTLMTYGWGDGGGGPTAEMLHAAQAQADLPGHPAVRLDTVAGFFEGLEREVDRGALPVWDGELYQESARGAYTSQSRNKRANRRSEALYHETEWLASLADLLTGSDAYPAAELRRGWERLLLLQFHDVLPGTSIHDVHEDSLADYARVAAVGVRARRAALRRLLAGLAGPAGQESLVVLNSLAWRRGGVVSLPLAHLDDTTASQQRDVATANVPGAGLSTTLGADYNPRHAEARREEQSGGLLSAASKEPGSAASRELGSAARGTNLAATLGADYNPRHAEARREEQSGGLLSAASKDMVLAASKEVVSAASKEKVPASIGRTAQARVANAGWQVLDERGEPLLTQVVREGDVTRLLVEVPEVPAMGYRTLPLGGGPGAVPDVPVGPAMIVTPGHLENDYYRIVLNERGQMVSLYDKRAGREVLARSAAGNVLQAFEDRPAAGGAAWELDIHYQAKMTVVDDLVEAVVEETGPVRGTLRLAWRYGDSTISQRLTIYRRSPRIDLRCALDWHEHDVMLKAAFALDVRATFATYEIQFGTVERPTHWNTPHDTAHFENPAQRWVDLSEGDYGLALLNDCKHGYDVRDNVLRLTLHRSPTDPDPEADQGRHLLTYSLLPHAGTWREANVAAEAAALNNPLRAALLPARPPAGGEPAGLPPAFELARVDNDQVVLDTVKRAEDGDGWIVRLYEAGQGRHPAVAVTFGLPLRRAVECDLLEQEIGPAGVDGRRLSFAIAPSEIRTFRVWFRRTGLE